MPPRNDPEPAVAFVAGALLRLSALVPLVMLSACHAVPPLPSITAEPCGFEGATCGHIIRPIDPADPSVGSIEIHFARYPHRNVSAPPEETIVATEGGPGYATLGTREAYVGLFQPLMADHDLLLIDNRGTGRSQAIDCHELETIPVPTPAVVGECGRSLGKAADYYGTPFAADDMAAVLDALGIARIDLYGDSYGTFTSQIFAQRHPERLRSLVLDGAFGTRGESGFFPNTPAAIRRNIDIVCERSPSCRAHGGSALGRLAQLMVRLRAAPITGTASDADGKEGTVTVDPTMIGTILTDATFDPLNLRDLDAAVRALDDHQDALPLLRLAAETRTHAESRDPGGSVANESYGLFVAVSCMDYPQIYDMTLPPEARRAAGEAALRRADPALYAPLTIAEWRGMALDSSVLDLCVDWPIEAPPYPPGRPVPQTGVFATVPTLVLSGEMDTTTPIEDADLVAAPFPQSRHLVLANSFHVNAIEDEADCAAPIVRRFVANFDPGDVSCAALLPPVRLAADFVVRAGQAAPATGQAKSPRDLSLAAAAVATVSDVLARSWINAGGSGVGLRGGNFTLKHDGDRVTAVLQGTRWADDLAISGRVEWDQRGGEVVGDLVLEGAATGALKLRWNELKPDATASIEGTIDGAALHAGMPAP